MHVPDHLITICTGSPGKFQDPTETHVRTSTHVHTEMAVMATELHALLAECPLTLRSPQSSLTQPSGLLQCQGAATEKEMHVLLT